MNDCARTMLLVGQSKKTTSIVMLKGVQSYLQKNSLEGYLSASLFFLIALDYLKLY